VVPGIRRAKRLVLHENWSIKVGTDYVIKFIDDASKEVTVSLTTIDVINIKRGLRILGNGDDIAYDDLINYIKWSRNFFQRLDSFADAAEPKTSSLGLICKDLPTCVIAPNHMSATAQLLKLQQLAEINAEQITDEEVRRVSEQVNIEPEGWDILDPRDIIAAAVRVVSVRP
jgi:hypothetical protein